MNWLTSLLKKAKGKVMNWLEFHPVISVILIIFGIIVFSLIINLLFAIPVYFLWNWLIPAIFNIKRVTLWEAWGIVTLLSILFGSGHLFSMIKDWIEKITDESMSAIEFELNRKGKENIKNSKSSSFDYRDTAKVLQKIKALQKNYDILESKERCFGIPKFLVVFGKDKEKIKHNIHIATESFYYEATQVYKN